MSWIDAFLTAYNKIQSAGLDLVRRQTLNFTNATVVDNPATQSTDVTVATLATPTGTGFVHVTGGVVDGAATTVALGSQVSGTLPLANLTHGTAGQLLATNGAATAPTWVTVAVDLTASTSTPGDLYVAQISGAGGAGGVLPLLVDGMSFDAARTGVGLGQDDSPNDDGESMTISAQNAQHNGGGLLLQSGGGALTWGSVVLRVGGVGGIDALTVSSPDTSTTEIEIAGSDVTWRNDAAGPTLTQAAQTTDVLAPPMTIAASSAWTSAGTHTNGAALLLSGGDATLAGTTGKRGGVRLGFYQSGPTAYPMVEVAEVGPNRRVVALCQATGTSGVTSTNVPGTGSDGVMFVFNAQSVPGADPVGGCFLYATAGGLVGHGSSGTVTTIAPAEPHCPVCGSDFGHEWSNPEMGQAPGLHVVLGGPPRGTAVDPSDVGKKIAELAAQKTGSRMAPTQDEWTAHIKESKARATELDTRDARIEAALHDLALSTGSAISDLTAQITGLRITVESFANKNAQIRASAQLAHAPPLDAGTTHTTLRALGDADADAAVSSLSVWKAKPTLVVGFAGAVIALAVAFGLPITKEQVGAILAVVFSGLTLAASMRTSRTTRALVRSGERRGAAQALAGPESQR